MARYLIIKTSSLGDIIQALPTLAILKRQNPLCKIDWVVEEPFADILEACEEIDTVIKISSKAWKKRPFSADTFKAVCHARRALKEHSYDMAFDLQGNIKSGLILKQVHAKTKVGFGRHTVPEWPNSLFTNLRFDPPIGKNIRDDYAFLVRSALSFYDEAIGPIRYKPIVLTENLDSGENNFLICPGSAWKNKQLPFETLRDFLRFVYDKYEPVLLFLWGNEEERKMAEQLHACFPKSRIVSRMGLPELRAFMSQVNLVIGMDSLPLHLAGTTATPTFSIFGASLAKKYKPEGKRHLALQGECPYHMKFEKRCPLLRTCPTGACIRALDPRKIYEDFAAWFEK